MCVSVCTRADCSHGDRQVSLPGDDRKDGSTHTDDGDRERERGLADTLERAHCKDTHTHTHTYYTQAIVYCCVPKTDRQQDYKQDLAENYNKYEQ